MLHCRTHILNFLPVVNLTLKFSLHNIDFKCMFKFTAKYWLLAHNLKIGWFLALGSHRSEDSVALSSFVWENLLSRSKRPFPILLCLPKCVVQPLLLSLLQYSSSIRTFKFIFYWNYLETNVQVRWGHRNISLMHEFGLLESCDTLFNAWPWI